MTPGLRLSASELTEADLGALYDELDALRDTKRAVLLAECGNGERHADWLLARGHGRACREVRRLAARLSRVAEGRPT
ncbi:MAG: hypothetical protein ACRDYU_03785 [Actinomycetes bacterium]